ncbi:hypothetical protein G7067_06895 [Leucobacter insecticola]|uniref:Uncharacterized protein n=1 Tax=Leucobacter insecticola TaxID=2714934 RepID=A0A6G8FIN6_9MICO|nr:hypothetical protein [Leucobacter insecticola]QIM16211.1 hypothetical protein G7067_06895 [Leucobacter insecticola]
MSDLIERLTLLPEQVAELLALGNDRVQVVVFDHVAKVNSAYGLVASLREYVDTALVKFLRQFLVSFQVYAARDWSRVS